MKKFTARMFHVKQMKAIAAEMICNDRNGKILRKSAGFCYLQVIYGDDTVDPTKTIRGFRNGEKVG